MNPDQSERDPPATSAPTADPIRSSQPQPADIRGTIVIKEGDLFLITDLNGNAPSGDLNGLGLYHRDTRVLSTYELEFEHLTPTYLLSTGELRFAQTQELTNPDLRLPEGTTVPKESLAIRRTRVIVIEPEPGLDEELRITNFTVEPVHLSLTIRLDADFADLFEIRGFLFEGRHGRHLPPVADEWSITFRYTGEDKVTRATAIRFVSPPAAVTEHTARFEIDLGPRDTRSIRLAIRVAEWEDGERGLALSPPRPIADLVREGQARYRSWLDRQARLDSSNQVWNDVVEQSRLDIRMLMSGVGDSFPAAGVPWYATLFGRDSLVAGIQNVWEPTIAAGILRRLASLQGTMVDPWRDEEPGKILHELRRGELARANLVPFNPYYGTIDATPLFVMLLAEYFQRTNDLDLVRQLEPNMRAALTWIREYGDLDGDGFVEYERKSASGLVNQGWKDSWDAITQADGSLVQPPVALVEVQAYVYAALRGGARLYRAMGMADEASRLTYEADWLRNAFDAAFWMPDEGFYCLALDGRKRQAKVISSNPGHVLWCGIAPPERGEQVARRLLEPDLFSGWGVRTLSAREDRYNPIGYHVGSVWPHDNSLIAMGLKRYGSVEGMTKVATGLFRAARHFPLQRIPELFCGYDDQSYPIPVQYPVACSPQAWAASAPLYLLQAMLGLVFNAPARELRIIRPALPEWLRTVTLERVPVGASRVDLRYRQEAGHTYTEVLKVDGNAHVTFYETWPEE